ncbi:hypothetical protein ACFLQI_01550 [Candidatus Undinarchaeota archaeon]
MVKRKTSPKRHHSPKSRSKRACFRHGCNIKSNLKRCRYCGKYFCKNHYKATLPTTQRTHLIDKGIHIEELRSDDKHPCPDLYPIIKNEEKEKTIRILKNLDILLGKGDERGRWDEGQRHISYKSTKIKNRYVPKDPYEPPENYVLPDKATKSKSFDYKKSKYSPYRNIPEDIPDAFEKDYIPPEKPTPSDPYEPDENYVLPDESDRTTHWKQPKPMIKQKMVPLIGVIIILILTVFLFSPYDPNEIILDTPDIVRLEFLLSDTQEPLYGELFNENNIIVGLSTDGYFEFPEDELNFTLINLRGEYTKNYFSVYWKVDSDTLVGTNILSTEQERLLASGAKRVYGKTATVAEFTETDESEPYRPSLCKYVEQNSIPILCGCEEGMRKSGNQCIEIIKCSDETYHPECSKKKPYRCVDEKLVPDAGQCGCPYDYVIEGDNCKKIKRCDDGTIYGECSKSKPLYCDDGTLVNSASLCGCHYGEVQVDEVCKSQYETGAKEVTYNYLVDGQRDSFSYVVYGGLNGYLYDLPRSMSYVAGTSAPSDKDFIMRELDNAKQEEFLDAFVEEIKSITSDNEKQARIAISAVQHIPYDYAGLNSGTIRGRYPYEVLYVNTGVCSDKTKLMIYLLRELGYGTAVFRFNIENHDAVGLKCPMQYSYLNSGYCFVESTAPGIITNSYGTYVGAGELTSSPQLIKISDGATFENVGEDYRDAKRFDDLTGSGGGVLPISEYNEWVSLVNKYDIKIGE